MSDSNPPTLIIASGSIEAAIWINDRRDPSSTEIRISRCYRDGAKWRRSSRFYARDLANLRLICEEAYRELALRRIEPRSAHAPHRNGQAAG